MSSYLKFLQELALRQVRGLKLDNLILKLLLQEHSGGLASKLFSTAVISGSKSLPNLVAGDKSCSKYAQYSCHDHALLLTDLGL